MINNPPSPVPVPVPVPGGLTRSRRPRPAHSAPRAASAATPPSSCTPGSGSGCLRCKAPRLWPPSRPRTGPEAPLRPHRGSGSGTRCRPTCCGWLPAERVEDEGGGRGWRQAAPPAGWWCLYKNRSRINFQPMARCCGRTPTF